MSRDSELTPASSQTVGPYFRIGLEYLVDCEPSESAAVGSISICGTVFDRDGAAVPDAMLEFWSASLGEQEAASNSQPSGLPRGFKRAATDLEGHFSIVIPRPAPIPIEDGQMQAPHLLVLVFARGLLRNLISRVYFDGEPGNASDPVLLSIPPDRRRTLIAKWEAENVFCWNVRLQGADETVFFAW